VNLDPHRSRHAKPNWAEVSQASEKVVPARELTHPLYRYPASMSPSIARAIILTLSNPGDTVLDPFCGGGTTAVEALAHGRRAICSDLNSLACFVTRSKASPLKRSQIQLLKEWVYSVGAPLCTSMKIKPIPLVTADGTSYSPCCHGLLLALKESTEDISDNKVRQFAKLMVLRVGQICFDCRQTRLYPTVVTRVFHDVTYEALAKSYDYAAQFQKEKVPLNGRWPLRVFQTDAEKLGEVLGDEIRRVSLLLTSPPYPGIHVLYHRWQFRGRREIALPYEVAGLEDGAYEAHYTLGPRREPRNERYFSRVHRIFSKLNQQLTPGTYVAQVIAFARPEWQLGRYMNEMLRSGLREISISREKGNIMSRYIPNRKWYIRTGLTEPRREEYLLFHQSTGVASL